MPAVLKNAVRHGMWVLAVLCLLLMSYLLMPGIVLAFKTFVRASQLSLIRNS